MLVATLLGNMLTSKGVEHTIPVGEVIRTAE